MFICNITLVFRQKEGSFLLSDFGLTPATLFSVYMFPSKNMFGKNQTNETLDSSLSLAYLPWSNSPFCQLPNVLCTHLVAFSRQRVLHFITKVKVITGIAFKGAKKRKKGVTFGLYYILCKSKYKCYENMLGLTSQTTSRPPHLPPHISSWIFPSQQPQNNYNTLSKMLS